jgi:hypothetical protein
LKIPGFSPQRTDNAEDWRIRAHTDPNREDRDEMEQADTARPQQSATFARKQRGMRVHATALA